MIAFMGRETTLFTDRFPVLRIRDILVRIRIRVRIRASDNGSVSGSVPTPDPWPDTASVPALFVIDLQDANKKLFFA
jgi:hypothetical protein